MKRQAANYVVLITLMLIANGPASGTLFVPAQTNSSTGAISSVVGYPSDYLPPMRIYAISTGGERHYTTRTRANQARFTITNVRPGTYHVVAYTDEAPGTAGGWSRAVPCGLRNTCRNHALIPVNVLAGSTTRGIRVADWYAGAGVFPPEPATNSPANEPPNRGPSIRSTDFRNFTYTRPGIGTLVLRNGREDDPDGSRMLSVSYVDFDGDGREEALITIANGTRGSGGYAEEYYVYANRRGSLQQLFFESRAKPQRMSLNGRSIVIVAPLWRRNDPGCCPSAVETAVYSWRGSKFVRTSRRLRPSR